MLGSRGPLSTLTPEASVVLNFSSIKQQQELSLCTSQAFVLSVSLPGLLLHKNQFILIFFSLRVTALDRTKWPWARQVTDRAARQQSRCRGPRRGWRGRISAL